MPKVSYEKDGRIGRITLNRPEVLNAIDDEVPAALAAAVEAASGDPGVHVIVLSGAGRAFCAGYDLTYYAEAAGANHKHAAHLVEEHHDVGARLEGHVGLEERAEVALIGERPGPRRHLRNVRPALVHHRASRCTCARIVRRW